MTWKHLLPIAGWLPDYTTEALRGDLVAGLTVGVMLIPQGMAYAVIAGLPPIYGLYAGLVPLVAFPLVTSSRHVALGPTALDMLILAAGLSAVAAGGDAGRTLAVALVLTAFAGALQIGMGLVRLGFVANLLSRPVIAGLTSAAALIIGFSQIGNLLGLELGRSQFVHVLVREAAARLGEADPVALAVGGGSIAVLLLLQRLAPRVPDALVVVVGGTLGAWWLDLHATAGLAIVGEIPRGLPGFDWPGLAGADLRALLPAALTIALVQFMNTVSLGRVFAARHGYTIDPNRELVGLGLGNLAGSFFGGIPASGSFSRTAVNDQAGARSALANVFAAAVILLTLLFLTPLFYHLPMPVLAAIIMVSGFGLIDFGELRDLFQTRRRDGAIALFTAACVLVIGIQEGILLGIGASMVAVLYRISRPNVAELGHVPGTRLFRDLERFDQAVRLRRILVLRVDAAFSFANAEYFKDFILEQSERLGRPVDVVVIDGTSINDMDTTAVDSMHTVIEALAEQGIEMHLTGLIGPVREVVRRSGLLSKLGEDHFHMDAHEAVTHVLERFDAHDDGDRAARYREKADGQPKRVTPTAS
jgi:SulP family sulfate permease